MPGMYVCKQGYHSRCYTPLLELVILKVAPSLLVTSYSNCTKEDAPYCFSVPPERKRVSISCMFLNSRKRAGSMPNVEHETPGI